MAALVIAEHDNATLRASTLNTITAAAKCGGEVAVLVAGHNCGAVATAAAAVAGVSKVLVADAPQHADHMAENLAEQVLAAAGGYSHILAPATAFGKNVTPRVAARLDVGQVSETHLGVAAKALGLTIASPVFDGIDEKEIVEMMNQARKIDGFRWVKDNGKVQLIDGRTGVPFDQEIVVGIS